MKSREKIIVIDFGGQYAHLVCNAIRRLGVYAEIVPYSSRIPFSDKSIKGFILSGGPSSVYVKNAPACQPEIFETQVPILGICYGLQLLVQNLGGKVNFSKTKREYGPATLQIKKKIGLLGSDAISEQSQVWMSHGDEISMLPQGFETLGITEVCQYAVVGDFKRKFYGLQFHPEVSNTIEGEKILAAFIDICHIKEKWRTEDQLPAMMKDIRSEIQDRLAVCMLSGGVDSTVLLALLQRSLPKSQIFVFHIDTGFLRKNESREVKEELEKITGVAIRVLNRQDVFFRELKGVFDPEKKREIIGRLFVSEQKKEISKFTQTFQENWCWLQGTIYPDTIESGWGAHARKIKTHHNRVTEISHLLQEKRLVEPLRDLYKDEVRAIGLKLNLPPKILQRHPFPGVGLAIRYICNKKNKQEKIHSATNNGHGKTSTLVQKIKIGFNQKKIGKNEIPAWKSTSSKATIEFKLLRQKILFSGQGRAWLPFLEKYFELPIQSVGIQGDQRTYRKSLALIFSELIFSQPKTVVAGLTDISVQILNQCSRFNRVLLYCPRNMAVSRQMHHGIRIKNQNKHSQWVLKRIFSHRSDLSNSQGISLLREADFLVKEILIYHKIYQKIWQLAVISLPVSLGKNNSTEVNRTFVIRAVSSKNAMTAEVYPISLTILPLIANILYCQCQAEMVFYDLSHKPPATIEWE